MDMTTFTNKEDYKEARLRRHLRGLRENQLSVAYMILYLHGYDFEVKSIGPPLASAAKECLMELNNEVRIDIWSCSTTAGGFWTTDQRHMLKYGEPK